MLIGIVSGLTDGRSESQNTSIIQLQGQAMAILSPLNALQDLDLRTSMMSMFPTETRKSLDVSGYSIGYFSIDTKPASS